MNKKEFNAVCAAWDYIAGLIEACTADPETPDGAETLNSLSNTIEGLASLRKRYLKDKAYRNAKQRQRFDYIKRLRESDKLK